MTWFTQIMGRAVFWLCALWLLVFATPAATQTPDSIRDRVFVTAQRATTSVAGVALQQAALRQEAGDSALSALLRLRQELSEKAQLEETALSATVSGKGAKAEAETARIRAALANIRTQIEALDARIEAGFPAFRELINPRPMTVSEVQQTLRPGEVLIMTLTSDYDVFVWAISSHSADWTAASFEDGELVRDITLLRTMLDVTTQNRAAAALEDDETTGSLGASASEFDRALAYRLYQRLLGPLAHILDGATHLITVPDGPLTSLPFSVLVASPPEGDDADPNAARRTDWLVGRYAMTVLPNVSSLRALRRVVDKTEAPAARRPFVGFGDPIFAYDGDADPSSDPISTGDYVTRGGFDAVAEVAGLAPLPGTARELRQLADLTGADGNALFLGRAATEAAVRTADLANVDILAFATHGLLAGELSGLTEPALVFTPPGAPNADDDALLTATEAAGLKLSAQLIILSACNTAADDGTPGAEGLSGLARSFIYAGARSILVSHWPVDDYATSVLTTGMVAEMRDGQDRADALRASILKLMQDDPRRHYAHPRYWAPFVLVGDG